MIDATYLKAHRTASSLGIKKGGAVAHLQSRAVRAGLTCMGHLSFSSLSSKIKKNPNPVRNKPAINLYFA